MISSDIVNVTIFYERYHVNKLKIYSLIVKGASSLLMLVAVLGFYIRWIAGVSALQLQFLHQAYANLFGIFQNDSVLANIQSMPWWSWIVGMFVDGVSLSLLIMALYMVLKLMDRLNNHEFFSQKTVCTLSHISRIMLLWAVYAPVNRTLFSLITTLHNKAGDRVITVSFGAGDLTNILIIGFLMLTSMMLSDGYRLKQDQDLTV